MADMNKPHIYLDHAATTPLLPEVVDEIHKISQTIFGNPSSIHSEGRIAKSFIEEHRKKIASLLNCSSSEIYFTSGGTESNNLILKSAVSTLGVKRIITTRIEHSCNIECFKWLQKKYHIGIHYLNVDNQGQFDINELNDSLKLRENKTLVSLMHVNNELGNTIDLDHIGRLCKENNALFHSDTVQGIGFHRYDLNNTPIDFISGSAHKFYAPKGIGFVYICHQNQIEPLLHGGSQERNIRAGTENLIGIGAMSKALEWCHINFEERLMHLKELKSHFIQNLNSLFPSLNYNSALEASSPKILNVQFPYYEGCELLPLQLDIEGLCISGGSACNSGAEKASHVIQTIRPDDKGKAIRFSFGYNNSMTQLDQVIGILVKCIKIKS